jgi:hypothetical protein
MVGAGRCLARAARGEETEAAPVGFRYDLLGSRPEIVPIVGKCREIEDLDLIEQGIELDMRLRSSESSDEAVNQHNRGRNLGHFSTAVSINL